MAFRELDYQTRALNALDAYLDALKPEKEKADKAAAFIAENPDVGLELPNFPANAWKALGAAGLLPANRAALPYSARQTGHGQPVPNATLKVPTGGGKTYLACAAVSRIFGRYLSTNTGFVLWIVPNEAIYTQTVRTLRDRQHPYRQALDRAAAGKVKILEKGDPLNRADVDANLCIMVLMLQSSNRQNQDSLKLFQDRGDVHGFTPDEGAQEAHKALLDAIPNLSRYDLADGGPDWPMIKDSVGNALRIIRPVVVMDEGHRAISELAFSTLYGFNPLFVLELSATPKDIKEGKGKAGRTANVLVEISGRELEQEGMIKMPLNIVPNTGTDWKDSLRASLDKLNALDTAAKAYRGEGGAYIRPILLVQAERTGDDQRDAGFIHADDVKAWLLAAGLDETEIAIKTAQTNDLDKPENRDLIATTCRVRVIITKAALAEGWDCPFAYVLCSLAASGNESAMTQLVGRILRQPHAMRTKVPALDESYVFTHRSETTAVVAAIKNGLEQDGMGDLVQDVVLQDGTGNATTKRKIERRDTLRTTHIALPQVLWVEDGQPPRLLDAETDLFSGVDWSGWDSVALSKTIPENGKAAESQIIRLRTGDQGGFETEGAASNDVQVDFDAPYAVRMLSDIVANPYVARDVLGGVLAQLVERGFTSDTIGKFSAVIIDAMRKSLSAWRDAEAARIFGERLDAGQIEFRVRGDVGDWIAPDHIWSTAADNAAPLLRDGHITLERSLFLPIFATDLNNDETKVAVYLDAEHAIKWWHRNGTDRGSYALRGWRKGNVYPDFVFAALQAGSDGRIVALESKGDQLAGNLDTQYKTALLAKLTDAYGKAAKADDGKLSLSAAQIDYESAVVLFSDMDTKLPALVTPNGN